MAKIVAEGPDNKIKKVAKLLRGFKLDSVSVEGLAEGETPNAEGEKKKKTKTK